MAADQESLGESTEATVTRGLDELAVRQAERKVNVLALAGHLVEVLSDEVVGVTRNNDYTDDKLVSSPPGMPDLSWEGKMTLPVLNDAEDGVDNRVVPISLTGSVGYYTGEDELATPEEISVRDALFMAGAVAAARGLIDGVRLSEVLGTYQAQPDAFHIEPQSLHAIN